MVRLNRDLHAHRRRRHDGPRRRRAPAKVRRARRPPTARSTRPIARSAWRASPRARPPIRASPRSTRRWRACRTISSTSAPTSARRRRKPPPASRRRARGCASRRFRSSGSSATSTPSTRTLRRCARSCCPAAHAPPRRCTRRAPSAGAPSAHMVALAAMPGEAVGAPALAYINRLSDYLFVAARAANDLGRADVLWVPGAIKARRDADEPISFRTPAPALARGRGPRSALSRWRASSASGAITRTTRARWGRRSIARSRSISPRARRRCANRARRSPIRRAPPITTSSSSWWSRSARPSSKARRATRSKRSTATPAAST